MKQIIRRGGELAFLPCSFSQLQFVAKMVYVLIAFATSISSVDCAPADQPQLAARKNLWQEELEKRKYSFLKQDRGLISSLERYSASCQLQIIVSPLKGNPQQKYRMTLRFVREGKELLTLPGHTESIFLTADEKLYVANVRDSGCGVSAYDLTNGKELWTVAEVSQLSPLGASAYSNQVQMRLSRLNEVANEPEGAVIVVKGNEGIGDYITVLDRNTGTLLAHKIYRKGFSER